MRPWISTYSEIDCLIFIFVMLLRNLSFDSLFLITQTIQGARSSSIKSEKPQSIRYVKILITSQSLSLGCLVYFLPLLTKTTDYFCFCHQKDHSKTLTFLLSQAKVPNLFKAFI